MKKFWEMKQSANSKQAEIYIYGEITSYKWDEEDTTAASFQKDLKALGEVDEISLHVNSPGGNVFEGIAISNMLKSHKAHVTAYVDALAASIASVIVAGADKVVMYENSMQMIHHPFSLVMGNANELRKQADDLDAIAQASIITYLNKGGEKLTEEQIKQIMDDETWLTAQEAYGIGLCDELFEANQMVACVDGEVFHQFQHIPEAFKQQEKQEYQITEERKWMAEQAQANASFYEQIFGGM
ncbi:head maturation protease, ClpP-related [Listeria fleischmannii]|uniref:ATP-dependent Clp protease proteolytic subunit n=1 Tax=Listeria fleischmannii FSL S10-1203 TaxID=1265822 RepID=W7DIS4_9LIST|nr:head maturation protease, ClpP-related [Listeria fleischmannii]EUJ64844.1 hypothetical protein MCOL2_01585 [Listeria fleischmannii FSL S10-1203]